MHFESDAKGSNRSQLVGKRGVTGRSIRSRDVSGCLRISIVRFQNKENQVVVVVHY